MNFFDNIDWDKIGNQAGEAVTTLATDWIRDRTNANRISPQVQAQPAATLPVDVLQAQAGQSKIIFYIAIASAVIGAALLLFGKKKGGKK